MSPDDIVNIRRHDEGHQASGKQGGKQTWRMCQKMAHLVCAPAPVLRLALHVDPLIDADLRVPQHEGAVLASIDAGMIVHSRNYEGNLVHLSVTGPASLVGRLRSYRLRG